MKNRILLRTNVLICLILIVGFALTAILSCRANYSASLENIEQVSELTSEGIYSKISGTFTKPLNISLTMANDSLLKELLRQEETDLVDPAYIENIQAYLSAYREKYGYDSVFLVSNATGRYYTFDGMDRVLTPGNPENIWYFDLAGSEAEYELTVDNDEVAGANNEITVFVNCKIIEEDGSLLGAVGVGLRIDYFQRLLKSYQDQFGVDAYLINGEGLIEVASDVSGYEHINLFERDGFDPEARSRITDWRQEGTACKFWVFGEKGERQDFLVTRFLPELGWHLLVEQNTGPLLAALSRQVAVTVLVILAIIGIVLFVITHVIRGFNKRIVNLAQRSEYERRSMFEKATEQLFDDIYELDITNNRPANQATEAYFESLGAPPGTPFNEALHYVAVKQIKQEFRQGYVDTFCPENVLRAFEQGIDTLRYEFMISDAQGEYYWMRITAQLVCWEKEGSLHMLTYRQNIDAEKRQERRMKELARTDEMTGLLTKSATQRLIGDILQRSPDGRFAFFIFDIDNFKEANDRHGHSFGDGVIKRFTEGIRSAFRQDDVLGRAGGDEFVAFWPLESEAQAVQKAEELSGLLDMEYTEGENTWHVTASIGIAIAPRDGVHFEDLYQHADHALYETKARGRNGYTIFAGETAAR